MKGAIYEVHLKNYFLCLKTTHHRVNKTSTQRGLISSPDQETYGRFTPAAWEIIKKLKLTEEEQDRLRLMIETKTETITKEEAKAMLYAALKI